GVGDDFILCYVSENDFFFFQAEDGIRDLTVTGVQTCALPISVTGMVTGGLNVGPGDICIVSDAVVVGGIHMTGGTLEACGSMIVGGVHVTGGFSVTLGAGLDDASTCEGNSISGGVKISFVVGAGPGFTSVELEN